MGKLYDDCEALQRHIDEQGFDVFRARGQLAMKCGFLISLVKPDEADDPDRIAALEQAAEELFGLQL